MKKAATLLLLLISLQLCAQKVVNDPNYYERFKGRLSTRIYLSQKFLKFTIPSETMDDIEYMVFPRLPGYAEIGWSADTTRNWDEYKVRLATHGPRLKALEVNYYKSKLVPWKE